MNTDIITPLEGELLQKKIELAKQKYGKPFVIEANCPRKTSPSRTLLEIIEKGKQCNAQKV